MWDIVWVSPQGHRSVSVSRHFLLQAPQSPRSVRKRFSRDHCCRGSSKPGCRIVGSHTRWELTTWADFQLCLHRLLMSTVASPATSASWMSVVAMVGWGYQAGLANCQFFYIQFWYLRCCGCPRLRGRQHLAMTCHKTKAGFLTEWLLCLSPNSEVTVSETPPQARF